MSVIFQYIDAIIFYKDMFGCKSALTASPAAVTAGPRLNIRKDVFS